MTNKKGLKAILSLALVISMIMSLVTGVFAMDMEVGSKWQIGNYQAYDSTGVGAEAYELTDSYKSIEDGKVTMAKTITGTDTENRFTINLTVTTTESLEQIKKVISPAAAVVLVIDVSGSMNYCAKCGYGEGLNEYYENGEGSNFKAYHSTSCTLNNPNASDRYDSGHWYNHVYHSRVQQTETRLSAAKTAANSFVANYASGSNGAARWISVVTYSSSGYNRNKILVDWTDVSLSGNAATVQNKISGMTAYGGTDTHTGLDKANTLLQEKTVSSIASKFVVLLSDGNASDDSAATTNANTIKTDRKATLYTISLGQKVNLLKTLASSKDCYKEAGDDVDLGIKFEEIIENIKKMMSAWEVTDPMGQYIVLEEDSVAENPNVSVKTENGVRTLVWNLWHENPISNNGTPATYTYTMSYQVKLDTAAQGFEEETFYPTNGATKLTYGLDLVDSLGHVDLTKLKSDYFHVPTVKGKIPEVGYKIEYYWQDTATKGDFANYTLHETVDGPKTKLWTVIEDCADKTEAEDSYTAKESVQTKYSKWNYVYASANPLVITIGENAAKNVIRIYYDKQQATVTVNHHYTLTTIAADGTESTDTFHPAGTTYSGYVGESYKAELAVEYAGVTYAFDSGEQTIEGLSATAEDNVIDLYYKQTVDNRADANVTVYHVLETYQWVKGENGKYTEQLVSTSKPILVESATSKVHATYTTTKTTHEGYTAKEGNNDSIALTDNDAANVITLYFEKHEDEPATGSFKVLHYYTKTVKTVVDGEVQTTVDPDEFLGNTVLITYHEGEDWTLAEINRYLGEDYNSDAGNAGKLTITNIQAGQGDVALYYTLLEEPTTTTVTVEHYYRSIPRETVATVETVLDEEGHPVLDEDGKEVTVVTGTGTVMGTPVVDSSSEPVTSEPMYVGTSYTAALLVKEGYTFNESASDARTVAAAADNASVIKLYYDKIEDPIDNRDEATIDVKHIYVTHLETVRDGVVYLAPNYFNNPDGEVTAQSTTGKAGDSFEAERKTTYGGNTYRVVGEPILTCTLQPGANDTIEIYYEREVRDLESTSYNVTYEYHTYNMFVNDEGKAVYPKEPVVAYGTSITDDGYKGQIVSFSNGEKTGFTPLGTNPATEQTLSATASENSWTFVYEQRNPIETKVNVTVNHHYTTTTVAVDGTSDDSTTDVNGTPKEQYAGEKFVADINLDGFDYDHYTITTDVEATQDADSKAVTSYPTVNAVVDFYYTKTVDNSQPVTYTVQHIYRQYDWDNSLIDEDVHEPIETSGVFATTSASAATGIREGYDLVSAKFNGAAIEGFDAENPQAAYSITLVNGTNAVVYEYESHTDTRNFDVSIVVTHSYYTREVEAVMAAADDEAVLSDADFIKTARPDRVTESTVSGSKDAGIYEGAEYTAALSETEEYKFLSATPDKYTITVSKDASENTININYLHKVVVEPEPDPDPIVPGVVTYLLTVNWLDDAGNALAPQANRTLAANSQYTTEQRVFAGYSFSHMADGSDEATGYMTGNRTVTYVYAIDAEIPEDDVPLTELPDDDVPLTDVPDDDVPLTDMPDDDVPLVDMPDDEVPLAELPDDDVPLADVPTTGDTLLVWIVLCIMSAIALVIVNIPELKKGKRKSR